MSFMSLMSLNKNKYFHYLSIVSCLVMLAACGDKSNKSDTKKIEQSSPQATSTQNTPANPAQANPQQNPSAERYIVGILTDVPPFDFRDEKGEISGFDVDLLKAVAKNQNFNVDFVPSTEPNLVSNLNKNSYQIIAASLNIKYEDAKIDKSIPYANAPDVIMGKENHSAYKLEDLNNKNISVYKRVSSYQDLQNAKINANITATEHFRGAYDLFAQGKVEFVVGDAGVLNYYHKLNPDANKGKVSSHIYNTNDTRVAFGVRKGDTELINKINTGLKNIYANGEYEKIYVRWFGYDDSLRTKEFK